jgi:hypothetical protein
MDVPEAVRFATGIAIMGGVFVIVQSLLLVEHVLTIGASGSFREAASTVEHV